VKVAPKLIGKRRARIEMLPLIDIVFLLLVFFIYAMLSMAVHRSLPIALPSSQSAEIDKNEVAAVTIAADGTLYLNKKNVTLDELASSLLQLKTLDDLKAVALFADRHLEYQELFRVLDILKQSGLENVSLQVNPDK
jgi:biopolymer transport protein ExbD